MLVISIPKKTLFVININSSGNFLLQISLLSEIQLMNLASDISPFKQYPSSHLRGSGSGLLPGVSKMRMPVEVISGLNEEVDRRSTSDK